MEYTTYESKEAALKSLEGGLIEIADGDDKGRFAVKELVDLAERLAKKVEFNRKDIAAKEQFEKRAKEAEGKVKELEALEKQYLEQIEDLKKPGDVEVKYQAALKAADEAKAELRRAKEQLDTIPAKDEQIATLSKDFETLKSEVSNAKILESLRFTAAELNVPSTFIESPDFKSCVGQFEITADGEILTRGESQVTIKSFIQSRQKQFPHWNPLSQSSGANPGNPRSPLDGRAERFEKAKASGDRLEMIRNAPLVDIK